MSKSIQRARFVGARGRAGAGLGAASSGTMIERSVQQNPELWERPLREHLRVKAPLAPMCGSQGCVWAREDDVTGAASVVKITGDFQDFSAALYLEHLGKDAPPQLPRILAVGKLTGDFAGAVKNVGESVLYYIIREDLGDVPAGLPLWWFVDEIEQLNRDVLGLEDEVLAEDEVEERWEEVQETWAARVEDHKLQIAHSVAKGAVKTAHSFIDDIRELLEWSIENRVRLEDLSENNFGVRPAQPAKGKKKTQRARLVLRDFGYIKPSVEEGDDYYDPRTVLTLGGLDFDVG